MPANKKTESEEYYSQLAEHRALGDANAAHTEGTINPAGEPVERTGRYADVPQLEESAQPDNNARE